MIYHLSITHTYRVFHVLREVKQAVLSANFNVQSDAADIIALMIVFKCDEFV